MGKRCNSCIVTRRTLSRLESQSRSRTNPSSLALLAAGRSPKVRRSLYGGTRWRRSDCTHHSHHLRMREICTGHCDPQRGRRSHSDRCRYRQKCRPYCTGSRARCHLARWAVETARTVHLAKGPPSLCLSAPPFSATEAIDTPAEIPLVASGVDTSVRRSTTGAKRRNLGFRLSNKQTQTNARGAAASPPRGGLPRLG